MIWCMSGVLLLLGLLRLGLYIHNERYLEQMGSNEETFRQFIRQIHRECWCLVYVTSGYRSKEKQVRLHAQNSKNAKPGSSPHEFKRAIDINVLTFKGWVRKRDTVARWKATGVPKIAKRMGFRWGGNFRSYHDPIHFDVSQSGIKKD